MKHLLLIFALFLSFHAAQAQRLVLPDSISTGYHLQKAGTSLALCVISSTMSTGCYAVSFVSNYKDHSVDVTPYYVVAAGLGVYSVFELISTCHHLHRAGILLRQHEGLTLSTPHGIGLAYRF